MHGLRHKRLVGVSRGSTASGSTGRSNADCANSRRGSANRVDSPIVPVDCRNSKRKSTNGADRRDSAEAGVSSEMSSGEEDSNDVAATTEASVDPPKRGRKKRCRTELKLPPSTGKIQLKPMGSAQFSYVKYTPKGGYKYGSQVGVLLKRLYPGVIKVYDDKGTLVDKRAAFSWNDYTWGKHETGLSHARLVKHEFWNLFMVSRRYWREAQRNLEAYLVKRVSDLMHQARLDAVKLHFDHMNEKCDDTRARTILLTEEEYLKCQLDWCTSAEAWKYLCRYWTSDEFFEKRRRAQESRMKSEEDVAQNRGGSRPWAETQQFLEHKYGSEKAGTLNTYAVMKSGMRNVDSTGNSAPIPSQKAQKRLEDYKAGVGPDNNSKEFDAKVLYSMEGGLRHGRTPIGNGVVDKQAVKAAAKSKYVQPSSTAAAAAYESVLEENDRLKATNGILVEANGVNRELILRFYADFDKAPPTDLMDRLADLDTRQHQVTGSSHSGSHAQDMQNTSYASDRDNDERNNDMDSDGIGCNGMCHGNGSGDTDGEDNDDNQDVE